jgi:hypothetical protein
MERSRLEAAVGRRRQDPLIRPNDACGKFRGDCCIDECRLEGPHLAKATKTLNPKRSFRNGTYSVADPLLHF